MTISTHVLDTSIGRPAAGVNVRLEVQQADDGWREIGRSSTDTDGRIGALVPAGASLAAATYRLTFDVGAYFRARYIESFYPNVVVEFIVHDSASHHHVPLLVSPYGYTTYRGS
jgi:5-hydroxyisourate hydrolase